jgi:hypothetical protein
MAAATRCECGSVHVVLDSELVIETSRASVAGWWSRHMVVSAVLVLEPQMVSGMT